MSVDYRELDMVLSLIGAKRDSRPLQIDPSSSREKIKFELKSGVRIEAANFDTITTVAGMFSYNGEHAFLYIDEPFHTEDVLIQKPAETAQKFHLVKSCPHLIAMHNAGRSERYVLIQNRDGLFPSKPRHPITNKTMTHIVIDAQLLPCRGCLDELGYQGYAKPGSEYRQEDRERNNAIVRNFEVQNFFDHYEPFFFDTNYYRDNPNDGKANYTSEHPKIRDQLLIKNNYCCEQCGVQLRDKSSLLHMHHKNGRKGENRPENLQLLCILCHSLQPNHQHMKAAIQSRDGIYIRQALARQKRK